VSAGLDLMKSSYLWDKKLTIVSLSIFQSKHQKNLNQYLKMMCNYTRFNVWRVGLETRVLFNYNSEDPRDSWFAGINGAFGLQYLPTIEYDIYEDPDDMLFTLSSDQIKINRIYSFIGFEAGYGRIGLFANWHLTQLLGENTKRSEDIVLKKLYPFSIGIYFDLL
jgi:hypothetical protein